MVDFSFEKIKTKLNRLVHMGVEPELRLYLYGKEYMIIAYEDHCSFQRCGVSDGSGEFPYKTLEELFHTCTVDHILLEKDWKNIVDWDCFEFQFLENDCSL